MMCVGYVQILYTILKKELEHPWILVSEENLEPVLLRILRDDCIYIGSLLLASLGKSDTMEVNRNKITLSSLLLLFNHTHFL